MNAFVIILLYIIGFFITLFIIHKYGFKLGVYVNGEDNINRGLLFSLFWVLCWYILIFIYVFILFYNLFKFLKKLSDKIYIKYNKNDTEKII